MNVAGNQDVDGAEGVAEDLSEGVTKKLRVSTRGPRASLRGQRASPRAPISEEF